MKTATTFLLCITAVSCSWPEYWPKFPAQPTQPHEDTKPEEYQPPQYKPNAFNFDPHNAFSGAVPFPAFPLGYFPSHNHQYQEGMRKYASDCKPECDCVPDEEVCVIEKCEATCVDNPCLSSPCLNGGTCIAEPDGGFSCVCPECLGGDTCSFPVDPCKGR